MRAVLFLIAIFLVILSFGVTFSEAAATLGEADFKKMKIREIRGFLDDRGLNCNDCQEKSDFVKFAAKNAHVPVLSSKVKVPVPDGPFWEVWADIAKQICVETADKKGFAEKEKVCDALHTAVDSLFMQHGKRTAQKLKKKPNDIKKTSWGEPYQQAGRKMINNLLAHCFKTANVATCSSTSKIEPLLGDKKKVKNVDFVNFITNVGIENTNPMYEVLKAKGNTHDEL